MIPKSELGSIEVKDYVELIKKHLFVIVVLLLVVLSTNLFYRRICVKIYKATSTIAVERRLPKITERRQQDAYGAEMREDDYFKSQYDILGSYGLAKKVVDRLDKKIYPEFVSDKAPYILVSMLDIEPARGTWGIVKISARYKDPVRAAELANAVVKEFMKQSAVRNKEKIEDNIKWLNKQISELQKKSGVEQEELSVSMKKLGITSVDEDADFFLRDLKKGRMELQEKISSASKIYGEGNPNLVALKEQLMQVEKKIEEAETASLAKQNKMAEYNLLKKRVEADRSLYNDFVDKSRELEVFKGSDLSNIRVVDYAYPPMRPIIPRPFTKDLMLMTIIGLMFGVGVCLFFEIMNTTFIAAEEIIRFLKLPFIGSIESINICITKDEEKNLLLSSSINADINNTFNNLAETILFASLENNPPKTILIGSAVSGEGRSFVASNLAITFANLSERVVLVDMDLRKPDMHSTYKIDQAPGLTDYLIGNAKMDQVLKPTFVQNLTLLPAGTALKNPIGIIALEKVHSLILEMQQKFDRVVINSAPYLKFIDTSFLAHLVDGVVIVIRSESTRFEDVMMTKEKILSTKGKIMGAVLNNIPPDKKDIFYYYRHFSLEPFHEKLKKLFPKK